MAFSILYKRLFELQFLPGFALDAPDGTAYQDRSVADQALALDRFDFRSWIDISPTAETAKVMAGLKVKGHQTASRFFAGISVTEEDNAGNPGFRPLVAPAEDTRFRFVISSKHPNWDNLSNLPINHPFPAKLWLSNEQAANYPSFAENAPAYTPGADYEIGALVDEGGDLYEAIQHIQNAAVTPGTDPTIWSLINDHQYIHAADLKLIPRRFDYRLPASASETNVDWELIAPGPTTIASGNVTDSDPLSQISIDLDESPSGSYSLVITGTNGFSISYDVEYHPDLYQRNVLGVIEVVHRAGLGDFRIIENNGFLRTEANVPSTPVFLIPIRRKSAIWRYHFHPDLAPATPLGDLQAEVDNRYTTQQALPLIQERVTVTYDGGSVLPNPSTTDSLLKNEANQLFAEIYVYL